MEVPARLGWVRGPAGLDDQAHGQALAQGPGPPQRARGVDVGPQHRPARNGLAAGHRLGAREHRAPALLTRRPGRPGERLQSGEVAAAVELLGLPGAMWTRASVAPARHGARLHQPGVTGLLAQRCRARGMQGAHEKGDVTGRAQSRRSPGADRIDQVDRLGDGRAAHGSSPSWASRASRARSRRATR